MAVCTPKTLEFNLVIYAVLLQNVTDMIQLERPDWQQVMAYVTAIYKHFETWKTEGPLAAHLVSIWCCVQILFITSYFSSYSCKAGAKTGNIPNLGRWVLAASFPYCLCPAPRWKVHKHDYNPKVWNQLFVLCGVGRLCNPHHKRLCIKLRCGWNQTCCMIFHDSLSPNACLTAHLHFFHVRFIAVSHACDLYKGNLFNLHIKTNFSLYSPKPMFFRVLVISITNSKITVCEMM